MTASRKTTGTVEGGGNYDLRRYVFKGKGNADGGRCKRYSGTSGVSVQYHRGGGRHFYAEVKDGQLSVEPYEYFDRDAMFTCSAETLFKIADGKTDPILAVTLGKLKVEGNIDKALKLKDLINSKKKKDKKKKGK